MKIYVSNEIIEKVKENHDDVSIHLIAYDYKYTEINSLEEYEEEIKKQLLDKHYYEIKHKIIKELGSDLIRHIEENGYDDNTIQDFLKERGVK